MVDSVKKYIEENSLFLPEDKILLAVSGGIDSMVMAAIFVKSGYKVGIAHCNFSLRGEESDKDEQLVGHFATKHELPFYSIRFNTKEYAEKHSLSIQMAARELRYTWFRSICAEYSFQYIATAHNLDDKIETFFLNLTRGTGIKGLSGMPSKSNDVVHPILFASRKEIEEYANANDIAFREDASNATTYYARNRIRHNVISEFCTINPSFYSTMEGNMRHIMQVEELVQQTLNKLIQKACRQDKDAYVIDIGTLKSYQPLSLFLFELLHPFGFTAGTINDIEQALTEQTGKHFYSPTHQLVKNRDELLISPITIEEDKEYIITEEAKKITLPVKLSFESISKVSVKSFKVSNNVAYINADKLVYPLMLRKWKEGDCFVPFGMNGKKKLSDFFIDSKLSLIDKQQQWVLLSGSDIIWVIGQRTDNRYRVDENTKTVLKIEFISSFRSK